METPLLDIPDDDSLTRTLHQALGEFPAPLFAVLDGGHFDDLEDELADVDISSRSLFLDGGDEAFRLDGPWLVELDDPRVCAHVETLAIAAPCAVFWSCPAGAQALWQHLRTINQILIPTESIPGNDGRSGQSVKYERVLFRHWDPNVLASVMPMLDDRQLARVFGSSQAVLMNAPDYGGLKRAIRPDVLPKASRGPLQIGPEQIDRLKRTMLHSSRVRIARFLKGNVPPHFSGVTDEFFWATTIASEPSAEELGIKTERGRARWAYAMMLSDGKAANLKEVRQYIQDGKDSPDNKVRSLLKYTADAARASDRTPT